MEATYIYKMYKFVMQKSIYLNVLVTQVSGNYDHGATLNLHPLKKIYTDNRIIILPFSMALGFKISLCTLFFLWEN